ncbi:MAG: HAMP domain-containing histidine kinase [Hyphomicrobiaceae bacterium]|nr:HAMP domain-containing histidine kinase [Hyphomicrobiaceae bacterium]
MSKEHLSKPPTSSPGADIKEDVDTGVPMPRALAEATARLADSGLYGLVWLNKDLTVELTYGPLVDFVTHGMPLSDSVLALIGFEDEILALRDHPHKRIELPAVALASPTGHDKRLNFIVFWLPDEDRPMVLAYQANSQTELELELSRQIRARLMAEAEISAKSRELARANADLESFAAIVSHDLKAPLRHMRMIADEAIIKASELAQGADISSHLHQLQDLSRRMSHMLTELFDYASLGRKYEALAPLDTRQLVQDIADSLPESGMQIKIEGNWPTVTTLAAPLDLTLRNLIQNAVQHHDKTTGIITLKCAELPDHLEFSVSDDGPGILPKHHAAAFLPFRTLDSGSTKTGTGMGLAMVKKMVETAGGTITLTSDPQQRRGTTICVKWPRIVPL